MSRKFKIIFGTYLAAALVVLSICSAVFYGRLKEHRLAAGYDAHGAFELTVAAVDKMGTALKKSVYATDGGLCAQLSGEVYAGALAAETAMVSLPFETHELENLAGFLNLAGDYSYSLAPVAAAEGFSQEQREQLMELSRQAEEFAALLRELQMSVNNGLTQLDRREERLENVGVQEGGLLSTALLDYEAGFDMGELSYDGQYTTEEEQEAGQLSEEEMLELAARAADVDVMELKEEHQYSGTEGRRCYSAGEQLIFVSRRGLESIGQSRLVSSGRLSTDKARQRAEEFLEKMDFRELALVSYSDSGTIASFNFAQVLEDALRLDSLVKVSIALDDGSVYAFNGERYSREEPELNWKIDGKKAEESLPEGLSCQGSRKVTIESQGGKELPCYELSCLNGEDEGVKIFVNAETGKQCRIDI